MNPLTFAETIECTTTSEVWWGLRANLNSAAPPFLVFEHNASFPLIVVGQEAMDNGYWGPTEQREESSRAFAMTAGAREGAPTVSRRRPCVSG